MIHNITVLRLPEFNNSLLTKDFSNYSNGDSICVNLKGSNACYFYLIHSMGVFNSIHDFVVNRTFNNNHRI